MLRSFALVFSIVAFQSLDFDRSSQSLCRKSITGAEVDPADLSQAVGVTSWVSWVVNLLIVEWWLSIVGRSISA